jgi:hypothetical protein
MIVGAFDLHRGQITFDYMDMETGDIRRGRIAPADRAHLRGWLMRFDGQEAAFAVEGCTGWRYVVEELVRAGVVPHLAEPADSAALRGRKKRAKTDRSDSTMLREALVEGRLPESWIPPAQVLEVRAKLRLYKDLSDERVGWTQRIHATLFHMGAPAVRAGLFSPEGQAALECADLSPAIRQAVRMGLDVIEGLTVQLNPCEASWWASPAAILPAGPSTARSTASARSPRWPTGPRWVTAGAGAKRATISVARKLARRAFHILTNLGD